jgi:hypothetical protein
VLGVVAIAWLLLGIVAAIREIWRIEHLTGIDYVIIALLAFAGPLGLVAADLLRR